MAQNPSLRPRLTFTLPQTADVELGVYDVTGSTMAFTGGTSLFFTGTVRNVGSALTVSTGAAADFNPAAATTLSTSALTVSDGSLSSTAILTVNVTYRFTGFYSPISNTGLNAQKAGSTVPIKFSLGGYKGLNIFATDSPQSGVIPCDASATASDLTDTDRVMNRFLGD